MLHVSQQIGGAIGVALLNSIYVLGSTSHADAAGDGLLAGLRAGVRGRPVLFAVTTVMASSSSLPKGHFRWVAARRSGVAGEGVLLLHTMKIVIFKLSWSST